MLEALNEKNAIKSQKIERVVFNAITKQSVAEAMKHPRARSTARWSTPISPAAPSTISSASRSRRCCGASCRAPARPAASSPSHFASSATANSKSKSSSPANTGRSSPSWRRRAATSSRRASSPPTAPRCSVSISAPARQADDFKQALEERQLHASHSVEAKPARRNPPPPFTTSTMQQEASRKLGFAPAHTMRLAQRLYEGVDIGGETAGLITYMRTDGIDMAPEAITGIRAMIGKQLRHGIRAGLAAHRIRTSRRTRRKRTKRSARPIRAAARGRAQNTSTATRRELYELIWNRAVASQMESAELERTTGRHRRQGRARARSNCAPPARS